MHTKRALQPLNKFFGTTALLVFLLVGCGTAVSAATTPVDYYVSTSGSDLNDGSQTHPWFTIQHAINSFILGPGGTVIHVAGGTYMDYVRAGSLSPACPASTIGFCV